MKLFILMTLACCLSFSGWLQASGNREIMFNSKSAERMPEIKAFELSAQRASDLRYLGSTKHWHILGETLTSTEGGRPFDNTYTYKIASENSKISNGWSLEGGDYGIHVPSCPAISVSKKENVLEITLLNHTKNQCAYK